MRADRPRLPEGTSRIMWRMLNPSGDELAGAGYRALLYPRLVEEKMLRLLRQGKLSKWFSGIGQEAIAVGVDARPGS